MGAGGKEAPGTIALPPPRTGRVPENYVYTYFHKDRLEVNGGTLYGNSKITQKWSSLGCNVQLLVSLLNTAMWTASKFPTLCTGGKRLL